jgi:AcrR family transcriptional regulator
MAGLRARKKQRTREDLAATALRLFAERGFEATTVDDIVEPIQVSRSTFFRYFPTKEHVLFPDHDEQLAGSLRDSPPLEAVHAAALDAADAVIEGFRRDPEAYRTRQRIVSATPSLRALTLRLGLDWGRTRWPTPWSGGSPAAPRRRPQPGSAGCVPSWTAGPGRRPGRHPVVHPGVVGGMFWLRWNRLVGS